MSNSRKLLALLVIASIGVWAYMRELSLVSAPDQHRKNFEVLTTVPVAGAIETPKRSSSSVEISVGNVLADPPLPLRRSELDNLHTRGEPIRDAEKGEACAQLEASAPDLSSTWPSIPDSLPREYNYLNSGDSDLGRRALQGDGYAQQLYATRIQAEIMGRGVEINGDKELVREWLAEFQVMENYYILGILNNSNVSAATLGESLLFDTPAKDIVSGLSWLFVGALMDSGTTKNVLSLRALYSKGDIISARRSIALYLALLDIHGKMQSREGEDKTGNYEASDIDTNTADEILVSFDKEFEGKMYGCFDEIMQESPLPGEENGDLRTGIKLSDNWIENSDFDSDSDSEFEAGNSFESTVAEAEFITQQMSGVSFESMSRPELTDLRVKVSKIRFRLMLFLKSGRIEAAKYIADMYASTDGYLRGYDEEKAWAIIYDLLQKESVLKEYSAVNGTSIGEYASMDRAVLLSLQYIQMLNISGITRS